MIATYSPEDISILVGGVWQLEGLNPGSFITLTKDVPRSTTTRSTDGQYARTVRRDDGYTLRISLSQFSQSNDWLMRMLIADMATYTAKFPVFIKDNNGSSIFMATTCWVVSEPEIVYSTSAEMREWVIQCTGATLFTGSNEADNGAIQDAINLATAFAPNLGGFL